jgi:hypothetical protein
MSRERGTYPAANFWKLDCVVALQLISRDDAVALRRCAELVNGFGGSGLPLVHMVVAKS